MTWISAWEEREERVNQILTQGLLDNYKGVNNKPFRFYADTGLNKHLLNCDEAFAELNEAHDGVYGCETGCDYYTLEGTISCPHGYSEEYDASQFGSLDWVFDL